MRCKENKYGRTEAFRDLGKIDVAVESGKISKSQHNSRTRKVLKKLVKSQED